jgi:hypothetical protein
MLPVSVNGAMAQQVHYAGKKSAPAQIQFRFFYQNNFYQIIFFTSDSERDMRKL